MIFISLRREKKHISRHEALSKPNIKSNNFQSTAFSHSKATVTSFISYIYTIKQRPKVTRTIPSHFKNQQKYVFWAERRQKNVVVYFKNHFHILNHCFLVKSSVNQNMKLIRTISLQVLLSNKINVFLESFGITPNYFPS